MNKKEFQIIRISLYIAVVISYCLIYNCIHIHCKGCVLCGMTRAIKSILLLDFKSAISYNSLSIIFMFLIPLAIFDFIYIVIYFYREKN